MKCYPIYDRGRTVGKAYIAEEGMFLRIRCECVPLSGGPERIDLKCSNGTVPLGLSVPQNEMMTLVKRVPKRIIPHQNVEFIINYGECSQEKLETSSPIKNISALKKAKLEINNGIYYLVFDQSSSKPTGQWSEPKISE